MAHHQCGSFVVFCAYYRFHTGFVGPLVGMVLFAFSFSRGLEPEKSAWSFNGLQLLCGSASSKLLCWCPLMTANMINVKK